MKPSSKKRQSAELNAEEISIIKHCRKLAKKFGAMERLHPDDQSQVNTYIYSIQKIVMARVAQREMPELFSRDGWNPRAK